MALTFASLETLQDTRAEAAIDTQVETIIADIDFQQADTFHEQVDLLRNVIQDYSAHDINKEFKSLWRDPEAHYKRFIQSMNNPDMPEAPMECSTRADLMGRLLEERGYDTRMVDVYSFQEDFPAHTFIEVQNPVSAHWEIVDPDVDVFWQDPKTGERVGITEIVDEGVEDFIPCSTPDSCGWNIDHSEDGDDPARLRHEDYFSMARIREDDGDKFAYFNSRIFSPYKDLPSKDGTRSFCDTWDKVCDIGLVDLGAQ